VTAWSNIGVIQAYRYLFVGYTLLHFAIAALYLVLPADVDLPKDCGWINGGICDDASNFDKFLTLSLAWLER
jgi:hypothetical protein